MRSAHHAWFDGAALRNPALCAAPSAVSCLLQVLVSHDFRLISQVAEEIWVVGNNTVSKWPGSIEEYKEHLKATHAALVDSKPEMTER